MEKTELICFQIIANAGGAKTVFMEALSAAKDGHFKQAEEKIQLGEDLINKGHELHECLIQKEAAGQPNPFSLVLLHAEDQLMSALQIKTLVQELIDVYKRLPA